MKQFDITHTDSRLFDHKKAYKSLIDNYNELNKDREKSDSEVLIKKIEKLTKTKGELVENAAKKR